MFNLAEAGYREVPLLVTETDGVATKLQIAQAINKHDIVGINLVAMNANDLIVQGVEPLYFTDVFSRSKLDASIVKDVIKGICNGCKDTRMQEVCFKGERLRRCRDSSYLVITTSLALILERSHRTKNCCPKKML